MDSQNGNQKPKKDSVNSLLPVAIQGAQVVYFPDVRLTDQTRIDVIHAELSQLAERSEVTRILLSFRNVRSMGSAMIGKLVQLNKLCRLNEVQLRLCDMNDDLLEALRVMRLDRMLAIHPTEAAALKAFGRKKKGWFGFGKK